MARSLFFLAAVLSVPLAAVARTAYPEIMATFDLAQKACEHQDQSACKKRDAAWAALRKGGYNFVIDRDNPNGYAWR